MHTNEEQCLLFPFTLSGGALNWYCRLPPETVDSFEELRKLFVSQHIFQIDCLHSADDLYTIRQKPDESLRMYTSRFSHEYSCCAEANDKIALKAFTAGLRDCFFKYMINANTWKTYSEVMAHAYNHASAEARTYQGKPPTATPYQQVGVEARSNHMRRPRPSKQQRCLPLPYLILRQVNRHINLREKGKIYILTSLILVKEVRDTIAITKGIATIMPTPRQSTQWAKHMSGHALSRGMRYTHL
ncbi:hypothetical protein ACFX15_046201 [Malus domestica]